MFRFLLLLSVSALTATPAWACQINNQQLGAKYHITISQSDSDKGVSKSLVLWRDAGKVAYEYPSTHIIESWEQTRMGMLRLVRYFDKYQRGIEYQPNEINNGKGEKDWSLKSQMISDKQLHAMQRKSTQGQGCEQVENYILSRNNTHIELQWLPNQKLIKQYKQTTQQAGSKVITQWKLVETITAAMLLSDCAVSLIT